jgi:hypothetical protein
MAINKAKNITFEPPNEVLISNLRVKNGTLCLQVYDFNISLFFKF